MDTSKTYEEYCKRIADYESVDSLLNHFREHVGEHYLNYNDKGRTHLKIWTIGVLNFMHIFKYKFPEISTEDMLFKLCAYHEKHGAQPIPPLDATSFIDKYSGPVKKIHLKKKQTN